jgi:hypothetical protein
MSMSALSQKRVQNSKLYGHSFWYGNRGIFPAYRRLPQNPTFLDRGYEDDCRGQSRLPYGWFNSYKLSSSKCASLMFIDFINSTLACKSDISIVLFIIRRDTSFRKSAVRL